MAGVGSATLSWQPPLAAPSPITAYEVTAWAGQVAQRRVRFKSNATSRIVTGLVNGTKYTFTVAAIDMLGNESASSGASNPVTPYAAEAFYSWGANGDGELGDGTQTTQVDPEAVSLAPAVRPTDLSAGVTHSLAIGSDHNLYAWGDGAQGQLGDGTAMSRLTPEQISLAPGVTPTVVSAGLDTSFAIGSDHNLYAWGDRCGHQLGDGEAGENCAPQLTPEVITLAPGITAVAVSAGEDFALAIGSDGYVYGWGTTGAFGPGTQVLTPQLVVVPDGNDGWIPFAATAISAGADHSLAISGGSLFSWGYNTSGQLGNGTLASSDWPEVVPGISPVLISAGWHDSLAVDRTGALWSWGLNSDGEVGDGTGAGVVLNPERITLSAGLIPTAICAGEDVGLAVATDGRLYGWGSDPFGTGVLGGHGADQLTPTPIATAIVRPTAISSNNARALVIIAP